MQNTVFWNIQEDRSTGDWSIFTQYGWLQFYYGPFEYVIDLLLQQR